jgi:hypothetical protein
MAAIKRQRVIVQVYPSLKLKKAMWKDGSTYFFACSPEVFYRANGHRKTN